MLRIALATLALAGPAHASITDQEILLQAPTPPSLQSRAGDDYPERPAQRYSVGLGGGINSFGGNAGKIFGSSPVLELRGDWAYLPGFSVRVGADLAKYSFNAEPNGSVDFSAQTLRVSSQGHFLSTALAGEGFDPYVGLSGEHVWRKQTFLSHNSVERDSAFAVGTHLGTNFVRGKVALWLEAGASKIFFQDRFESEYLESGVEDTNGLLYSGRLGVKYLF